MNIRRVTLAAGLLSLVALSACKSSPPVDSGSMGIVNARCPMRPQDSVDPDVTVDYNGRKVGFCCYICVGKWKSLTDAQRDERLSKAK